MKLVSFSTVEGRATVGVVLGKGVVDLPAAQKWLRRNGAREGTRGRSVPPDMLALFEGGQAMFASARQVVAALSGIEWADLERERLAWSEGSYRAMAPLPRPNKIILIGLNYRDHAEEAKLPIPDVPTVFSKYATSVIGPREAIRIPRVSSMVDYEGEFAFVIGKRGRHIAREDALEHVAGYTILNDVSARDYQMKTGQWMIGKTFDTFAPMGPYLVSKDEITDPHALELKLYVNDGLMQHSNTSKLIFKIPDLIEYLSDVFTLEPGDVISTGTPSGVGFTRQPPVFLKPGDRVRVEVSGLGALENPVAAEE